MGDGKDRLRYRGYVGLFTVSFEDNMIVGTVLNTKDIIGFHGNTVPEAVDSFHRMIDSYLEMCDELNKAASIFPM